MSIPAAQAQTFMRARAKRARRLIRNGGKLTCEKYHEDIACGQPATHVCTDGLRCKDHLEGTHYAEPIQRK